MHFIYLGNFRSPWSTEYLIANAIEQCGCFVDRLDESRFDSETLIRRVEELARFSPSHLPPVFLFAKGRLEDIGFESDPRNLAGVLRRLKDESRVGVVACWIFDLMCPEFNIARFIWASEISAVCDCFFTTDGYTLHRHGLPNGILLRQAAPIRTPRAGRVLADLRCSVAHIGSIYGERIEWHRKMKSAFGDQFRVFGNVRGDELFDLCASADIVLGPGAPYFPGYWSNRIYVVTAYGGFLAAPEVEGMFDEGWCHGNYRSISEDTDRQIDDLRYYLATLTSEERRDIAKKSQRFVLAKHTYRHRAMDLISHIEPKLTLG